MMRRIPLAAVMALSAAAAAPAYAGNHWYALGELSGSTVHLDRAALDRQLAVTGASGVQSSQSGSHGQWRLQLGYRLTPWLSVEGGYIDLGKDRYQARFGTGSTEARWKSGGVDLAAVGRLPLDNGIALLGKVGVIDARTRTQWRSTGLVGLPSGRVSHTRLAPFIGVGASYAINDRWSTRVELEHFSHIGSVRSTGRASVNTLSLGLAWHF